MLEKLRNFVSAPVFEGDEERTHTAHLLYVVAWTLIVSLTLMEISFIIAMPKNTTRWLLLAATADLANLAILALTQRGYTRLASIALIVELWVLTTVYAWTAGGTQAPAVMFYFIFVITAGLLLGSKAGAVAAVICSLTTLGMVYAEMMGMMPLSSVDHTTLTRWIAIVFLITILISIQSLTTNTTTKALQRAQQELKERRQVEGSLRASEAQYRMLIEESPTGIQILEADETGRGYRITAINSAGCQILGYPHEELIGLNINRLIDPDDLAQLPVTPSDEMQSGKTTRRERIVIRKDGTRISILGSFKQIPDERFLYIFQDITERKKAENDLRESEQRYRAVVENQTEFIVRWRPDGTRTFVNDAYCRYFDLTPEQALSTSFIPLIIGEDRQAMEERILRLMSDSVHTETYVHRVIRPDNSVGWQEWTDQAIRHETGQVVEFQSVGRDVTERKLAEEKLRKQAEQMSALYDIGLSITSNLNLNEIFDQLFEKCRNLLPIDTFSVALYDEATHIITYPLFYDSGEYRQPLPRDIREDPGLGGYVVTSRNTLYVPDITTPEAKDTYKIIFYGGIPSRSYVGVPMFFHTRPIGLIAMQNTRPDAYSLEQIRLFETIATQAAIAIENARLYQAEQERRREAETLRESLTSIVTTFELEEVVERILDQIKFVIPYDTASVWRVDGDWQTLIVGRDLPPELSVADLKFRIDSANSSRPLIQGEKSFVLNNNVQEELTDFRGPHSYINSWLAVPLKKRSSIIGVIALDGKNKGQFTAHHAELAVTFANQVAIALENASLYTEIQQELTERKRAEESLIQFRSVIDESNDAVFMIDPETGLYLDFSKKAYKFLGYSRDELSRLSISHVALHITDINIWQERVALVRETGSLIFEAIYRRKDRTTFPVEVSARMLNYGEREILVAIVRDITERKRADEELRRSEEKFRQLITSAPDAIIGANQEGKILFASVEATTLLGYELEELMSMNIEMLMPARFRAAHTAKYAGYMTNPHPRMRAGLELFATRKDGSEVPVDINLSRLDTEAGSLVTAFIRDITERKRAEQQIQQLNADLEKRVIERTAQLNEANRNIHQEKVRLEQYSRQRELMGTMTDLLQASLTTEEACGIVSRYMQLLFPNRDGALYLLNASETLEPIAIWGEQKSLDTVFGINDCWALRRGKSYRFGSGSPNPPCAHVGREITQSALCIPLAAQGESMGSLHISTENIGEGGQMDEDEQRFIETITDSVALALANVRLRERLRIQSIRDGLTSLFNRRYLDETLPREIHRAERSQRPISVLMFDIDGFKKFNDVYGHDGGDLVLQRMAELITSKVRPSDIACRSGGEEFVIILPDTPLEIAHVRAESLREAASQMKVQHNGKDLGTITISLGVAAYPQHGTTRDALIKSADGAAYQAKEAGKNRVIVAE